MQDNLQLTQEQMQLLRQKELELLKIFIEVCDKLQLNYFAVEGTLLGAVRHQGFIPWDDDIDVGMMRQDFEVFVQQAGKLLPEGFFLQTHQTDPEYAQHFAKLRNSDTVFLETTYKNLNINHGIYIDIFPFDVYPDGKRQGRRFDFMKLLVRYRLREIYYIPSDKDLSVANIIRKGITLISKIRFPSTEDAFDWQEKAMKGFPPSKRVINNGSPRKNRERMDAAIFCILSVPSE